MGNAAYLIVFLGAGLGGVLRHGVNIAAARLLGVGFPWGTLTVNVLGSFVMGVITEYWAQRSGLPQPARLFLTTGMLGGFTTFSTFSLDTAALWESGRVATTFVYVAASVLVSLGAIFAGLGLVRALLPAAPG